MSAIAYDELGVGYSLRRRPDPRIAEQLHAALGDVRTVVNVGAGTGSYEPSDREVVAVEPSEVMISQRPTGAARCVRASAEALPLADGSFDAAMAVLTIHHWADWRAGMRELRRVAKKRVVVLTYDAESPGFWLGRDYVPELIELDRRIMPPLAELGRLLGPFREVPILVPHDCVDGFLGAYWRRPEVYLDPAARRSISSFAKVDAAAGLTRLSEDLQDRTWHRRNADILNRDALDIGYRLLIWELREPAAA